MAIQESKAAQCLFFANRRGGWRFASHTEAKSGRGYSGIFTPKHVGEYRLRHADGEICQNVVGYDANNLYLNCIGQTMPCGGYVRRLAPHFTPSNHIKCESMFEWMDYISSTENVRILHARNHHEIRMGGYLVDGFHPETNIIYEYNGCFWHGRILCKIKRDDTMQRRWDYTQQRTKYLCEKGYKVVSIWEHEYKQMVSSNADIKAFVTAWLPPFYRRHCYGAVTENAILNAIREGTFYGFLEVDIRVPEDIMEKFHEMSPLFCTSNIPLGEFGQHMVEHVEKLGLSKKHTGY